MRKSEVTCGKLMKGKLQGQKKIVVVLNTEPEWGGEHQYTSVLMECLMQTAPSGMELTAICQNRYWRKWCRDNHVRVISCSWPAYTEKEQKRMIRSPLLSRISCIYGTELGKALRKEKADAVFVTDQGLFIPNMGIKVIAPVHDLMHRYEGRFPEVSSRYDQRELLSASKAKYAWCVLTDSIVGKQQFTESYSNDMGKQRPHIVSLPFVVPKHIVQCEEEPVDVPDKYIFYPAQFWKHKNHLNLIKAVGLLAGEIPDIHLVLAGAEKNALREARRCISDNGLGSHVTIKGFVSNGNITYLYHHAMGMVMPSYFGPTNIPPLEAMALGCPVAVSDKYAMPEQVGDAGLLFNPDSPEEIAECIRKLWCDNMLRQNLIKKGYIRIGRWTQKEFGERLKMVLDGI